ncbi:MAG TPA: DUF721 domain-containing protein [Nevskia sp.]|jgi:hypothetical protein|nr:DUF721 domain-containing protein [Nevskia sp.]
MKPPREPDAIGIGACLNDPGSSVHRLLARAGRLAAIQTAIREWAGEPLASSLTIANERDGVLVVYAASAAALTQVRYKQQELIQFLRERHFVTATKLEAKINPTAGSG